MQGVPNCQAWDHGRLGQVKCELVVQLFIGRDADVNV